MKVLDQKNRAELGGLHLNITATVNTWTHTRRKRREVQRLLMSQQSDTINNGNPTNNDSVSNEIDPMECGSNTNTVSFKNPSKRVHDSNPDEMNNSSESIAQATAETKLNSSVVELVNPPKRTRATLHDEICEEGEDAWFDGDECENTSANKINTCSNNESPSAIDTCSHVIQANVFVEYLNTDSFIKDVHAKSSLFPHGINNSDEVMHNDSIECGQTIMKVKSDIDASDDDDVILAEEEHGPLVIKIAWISGTCREAANQILFYLKNRLK